MRRETTLELSQITYTQPYWIILLPLIGAASDIITGWIQASVNSSWDSTVMRKGLYRKAGELLLVVLGCVAECAVPVAKEVHLATCFSVYVVFMEFVSVVENLNQAGVTIPTFLRERLQKTKDKIDKGE